MPKKQSQLGALSTALPGGDVRGTLDASIRSTTTPRSSLQNEGGGVLPAFLLSLS